jgi:hypothetical protein
MICFRVSIIEDISQGRTGGKSSMENGLQDYDDLEDDAIQGDLYEGDAPVVPQNTRLIISLKIAGVN